MTKPIEYALEIYKPRELRAIPAQDECRHYHSNQPFPSIHAGELLNAWVWRFPNDSMDDMKRMTGGRTIEPMEPLAVVESVMHEILENDEGYKYRVIIFTKLYAPPKKK